MVVLLNFIGMSKLNFHGAGAAAKLPNGAAAVFLQNAHGRPCWTWTASMCGRAWPNVCLGKKGQV